MTEWKPDNQFLDFLLANYTAGDPISEELIKNMHAGETAINRGMYMLAYDQFNEKYEVHKAMQKLTWSLN